MAVEHQLPDVAEISRRFADTATGHVADAIQRVGYRTPALGHSVMPLTSARSFAGPAHTLRLSLSRTGAEPRNITELIEQTTPGQVVVLDAQGICDWAIFGDRAGLGAQLAGAVGAVVNGGVRDVAGLDELGLPVFAAGTAITASEGHLQGVEIDGSIILDGVLIEAGDWLVADAAGICVVPQDKVLEVLTLAEEREAVDRESVASMRDGLSLRKAHRHFHDDDEDLKDS